MSNRNPSYVQEPNFIVHVCVSNGKCVISMEQVLLKIAGGIQSTKPSWDTTAIASRCSFNRVSALKYNESDEYKYTLHHRLNRSRSRCYMDETLSEHKLLNRYNVLSDIGHTKHRQYTGCLQKKVYTRFKLSHEAGWILTYEVSNERVGNLTWHWHCLCESYFDRAFLRYSTVKLGVAFLGLCWAM